MTPRNLQGKITGIILAGGRSSRMGTDKGLLQLRNKCFVDHIIEAMSPLVDKILIVSSNPQYDRFKKKRVEDIIPDAGPLAGVYTGLYNSETGKNLVLSCDVPMISTRHLEQLTKCSPPEPFDVIQLAKGMQTMPLIALYQKSCLPIFLELLNQGERKLRFAVNQCKTITLTMEEAWWNGVTDINTPDQLREAEDW